MLNLATGNVSKAGGYRARTGECGGSRPTETANSQLALEGAFANDKNDSVQALTVVERTAADVLLLCKIKTEEVERRR